MRVLAVKNGGGGEGETIQGAKGLGRGSWVASVSSPHSPPRPAPPRAPSRLWLRLLSSQQSSSNHSVNIYVVYIERGLGGTFYSFCIFLRERADRRFVHREIHGIRNTNRAAQPALSGTRNLSLSVTLTLISVCGTLRLRTRETCVSSRLRPAPLCGQRIPLRSCVGYTCGFISQF